MSAKEKKWLLLVLIIAGLVIGGLLGHLTANVEGLNWLSYGKTFGITEPLTLNLEILVITFGFTISVNIASIIGILIGVFIYTRI